MSSRVNLYEEMFDDLIQDRGHDAEWEQACVCHCVSRDSGQPNYLCPTCGGSGYRYLAPKKIRVAVTAFNSKTELEIPEMREPGTAYATPQSTEILGYKDRLRFPDFRCKFSEVLRFSEHDVLRGLHRGISSRTYRNIKEVLFLADDNYSYEAGIDFEVTEDGYHIRWLNEDYIDKLNGKTLSILYYTTPSYLVTDILHELRATMSTRKTTEEKFVELPKQYKLQREDFIYNIADPEPVQRTPITSEPDVDESNNVDEPEIVEPTETPEDNTSATDSDSGRSGNKYNFRQRVITIE